MQPICLPANFWSLQCLYTDFTFGSRKAAKKGLKFETLDYQPLTKNTGSTGKGMEKLGQIPAKQSQKEESNGNRQNFESVLQQFDNMSLKCFQRLSFLLILLAIAVPALQLNWQGSGNLTEDNMTVIHGHINNNPIASTATDVQINNVAKTISTRLNTAWDPAWNVVIVKALTGFDSIVYGYAFRNHWMWINGVFLKSDVFASFDLAYIIWKDYNCQNWYTISDLIDSGSTFPQNQNDVFNAYRSPGTISDIWANAHIFVEYINNHPRFVGGAFTAIMSGTSSSTFTGYICLVNRNYRPSSPFGGLSDTSVFLFQTYQGPS